MSWFKKLTGKVIEIPSRLFLTAGWGGNFSILLKHTHTNTALTHTHITLCFTHRPASFIHPHLSFFLSATLVWASRGVLLRPCEGCINYSCLVFWPQGQRCQSRHIPPQRWCIGAIKTLSQSSPVPPKLHQPQCDIWTVTQEVTVLFSCTMFLHGFRLIQAKDITAAREEGVMIGC